MMSIEELKWKTRSQDGLWKTMSSKQKNFTANLQSLVIVPSATDVCSRRQAGARTAQGRRRQEKAGRAVRDGAGAAGGWRCPPPPPPPALILSSGDTQPRPPTLPDSPRVHLSSYAHLSFLHLYQPFHTHIHVLVCVCCAPERPEQSHLRRPSASPGTLDNKHGVGIILWLKTVVASSEHEEDVSFLRRNPRQPTAVDCVAPGHGRRVVSLAATNHLMTPGRGGRRVR
ncbi:hypothetical protein E3N88_22778 [Mikania micrantha]|uniref:Uncharacterized protein n=1 Tax=Mikania micrantha TaxID=192012 RepID=A0A5N6ND33_9ASTR|nr:hypothetical protein E3N88_22778 [Mikania micrantha]